MVRTAWLFIVVGGEWLPSIGPLCENSLWHVLMCMIIVRLASSIPVHQFRLCDTNLHRPLTGYFVAIIIINKEHNYTVVSTSGIRCYAAKIIGSNNY